MHPSAAWWHSQVWQSPRVVINFWGNWKKKKERKKKFYGNTELQLLIIVTTVSGSSAMAYIDEAVSHEQSTRSPIFIKAYYVQTLFKALRIFFFETDKNNLSSPPQNAAYILGLHREPDHLATQSSKMYCDLRELSPGHQLPKRQCEGHSRPFNQEAVIWLLKII